MDDINNFLMAGGVPSFKFEKHGDTVKGPIGGLELQQQKDYATGAGLTWDDGSPRMQLRIVLGTTHRDPSRADDDGSRAVYAKGQLQKAIGDAVRKAGAKTIEPGGHLAVQYANDGEASKKGFNPPKIFAASYRPPTPGAVSVDDLI